MDFSQGHLPSCQTLAAIGAMSVNPTGRLILQRMILKKDSSYEVNFPNLPGRPITVLPREYAQTDIADEGRAFANRAIDALKNEFASDNYLWVVIQNRPYHVAGHEIVRVLEIAYAKYQKIVYPAQYADVPDEHPLLVYRHKSFHYQADESLRDLSGLEVETLTASDSISDGSHSFAERAKERNGLMLSITSKLEQLSEHPSDHIATACSVGTADSKMFLDPGGKIQPWHDHVIVAVSAKTHTLQLIDPFNSRITMTLNYDDFFDYFYLIALAKVIW